MNNLNLSGYEITLIPEILKLIKVKGRVISLDAMGRALALNEIAVMLDTLEQSSLPYKVDLLIKHKITSPELLAHIEQHGLPIK